MKTAAELQALIELEPADNQRFIGQNYQAPWKRLFGGQALAQSLYAAYQLSIIH
ncbi:acyl-CoA thioesterase II, partial [bacterium]|nr:acyl-CoA thioesterase II [bacterium]